MVDSAPIRDQTRRDYERARASLQKARTDLDRFNAQDRPLHQRWVASTFGALLTELRELHAKLQEAEILVQDVEDEYMFGEHRSMRAAYHAVKEERARPEAPSAQGQPDDGGFDDEDFSDETEEERAARDVFEKEARKLFSEAFGVDPGDIFGDSQDEGDPRHSRHPGHPGPPVSRNVEARVKDLYRSLVRRLHPDATGESNSVRLELWHQTQKAYENGDVEQLEVILATIEVEEAGTSATSVSVLKRIIGEFKAGLNSIKRMLSAARRDPAWNFSALTDREPLKSRMRRMFEEEKQMMSARLAELDRLKAQWEAVPRSRSKGRTRARSSEPEFEF